MSWFRCPPGVALLAAGVLAGCNPADSRQTGKVSSSDSALSSTAKAGTVDITAKDFAFESPARIPAGPTTVRLTNAGKELHQAQLIRLEQGKTVDDLAKALSSQGPPPSWVKFVGGPNGIAPGHTTEATSVLPPGRYAVLCFIPSPDGVMHAAKGMIKAFEVTGESPDSTVTPPKADVTFKLVDYDFQASEPLKAGRRTIMVENAGPQPHELVLLRLTPGQKVEDFARWAESMKGPPPAIPLGGVTFLDKGARGSFTVDLTPGEYGLICFVPDGKDGKPHLVHGMMKNITVS